MRTVIGNFDGEIRTLALEDDVYHNELIETDKDSATKLTFLDETTLTLGPDFGGRARPLRVRSRPVAGIVRDDREFEGIFRFASGKLPKNAYRLHTPAATIGIRGAVLDLAIEPAGRPGAAAVVKIALQEGEATIGTCRGQELVLAAGQSIELRWNPVEPCNAR